MLTMFISLWRRFFGRPQTTGATTFPRMLQWDTYSCGARSTHAILTHFGVDVAYADVKDAVRTTRDGTDEAPIVRYLRRHGLRVSVSDVLSWVQLTNALIRRAVVLVGLDGDHYGVVYGMDDDYVYLADPSLRRQLGRRVPIEAFQQRWNGDGVVVERRAKRRGRRL